MTYYTSTGAPVTLSRGASSAIRAQFSAVESAFDLLPAEAVLIGGITYSGTTTGSADAYVLSISDKVTAYTNGLRIVAKIHAVNTTASTINVNALGVIAIKRPNGDALAAGDLPASGNVCMVYNSTSGFFMLEAPTNATLQSYVTTAQAAADTSTNSAANVLAASEWVSGTTYARGDVRWSPIDYRNYRRKTAGGGTTDPSADSTNWARIGYAPGDTITVSSAVATTSGTSVDITGIPTLTKIVHVNFVGVSLSGTSHLLVQIGDAGGIEATGYTGQTSNAGNIQNINTGYGVYVGDNAGVVHGTLVLTLQNAAAFTWAATGVSAAGASSVCSLSGGTKSLSAELTQIRITTVNGTDTFDAGAVNITYI